MPSSRKRTTANHVLPTTNPSTIYIDEAGRGPLAGPVWVGAIIIFDPSIDMTPFRDSKKLSHKQREAAYEQILLLQKSGKIGFGSARASAARIDREGIIACLRQCIYHSVKKIITGLPLSSSTILTSTSTATKSTLSEADRNTHTIDHISLLIDGNHTFGTQRKYNVTTLIKGDDLIPAISMASIVAKVERDRYMTNQDNKHPTYGFARHKGYGTQYHRDMIQQHGACSLHRISYCQAFLPPKNS